MGTGFVTFTRRVGRLLECRCRGVVSPEVMRSLEEQLRCSFAGIDEQVLVIADARDTEAFDDRIAQQLLSTILTINTRVERAGILVGGRPLYEVQIEALLLATHHPNERTFRDPGDLVAFMGVTATDEERQRMKEFLAEWREDRQPALLHH